MELIAPGVHQLDTMLGGMNHMTAGFLIEGSSPALIETGAQTSAETVKKELEDNGISADSLRWIVVSHIHLDHAGAVGDIAKAFPKAKVVVHELGAKHLVDPTRLIDSASRVYGPLLDSLYGRLLPVDQDQLIAATDRMELDLGDSKKLTLINSPGHARHHLAVLDNQSGTLLVGDAVGVRLPEIGVLRPAAPPPDFDLELAIGSLHKFRELKPQTVVLTHYGPVENADETLAEAEDVLHQWVDEAKRILTANVDATVDQIADGFAAAFLDQSVASQDAQKRLELLNGIHSNAMGISRYLKLQEEAHADEPGHAHHHNHDHHHHDHAS